MQFDITSYCKTNQFHKFIANVMYCKIPLELREMQYPTYSVAVYKHRIITNRPVGSKHAEALLTSVYN